MAGWLENHITAKARQWSMNFAIIIFIENINEDGKWGQNQFHNVLQLLWWELNAALITKWDDY